MAEPQPLAPLEPGLPSEPVGPGDPVVPVDPGDPVVPLDPEDPAGSPPSVPSPPPAPVPGPPPRPEPEVAPTLVGWPTEPVEPATASMYTPLPTRREARVARRRQFRKKVGLAGGAAIVAIVLIVVAATAFGVHKAVTHHHAAARTQTTVLFQLTGAANEAAGSVLLAHDPATKQGVELLIPAGVSTDVCGFGTETFGNILSLPNGETASRAALTTMLNGVTVDGSWVVTPAQLTTLVNDIGGVTVSVDTNVVRREASGVGTILVPSGTQKLNGAQAVEYATYAASPSEDASAVLARLQQVVDATIQALPASPTAIGALIHQLGPTGASTIGETRLASFLAGLRGDDESQNGVFPSDLPYTTIDAGSGGQPAYRVDDSATGVPQLVKSYLAQSVPAGAGAALPTVFLLNGVGNVGLVTTACPKLAANGLAYAGSNNADTFSNDPSTVVIRSDSTSDIDLGHKVARALGLPAGDIERSDADQSVADVIVTLGSDYKP